MVSLIPVIMNLLKLTALTDEFHLFYPVLLRYKLEFFPLLKEECERQVLAKIIWEWVTRAWRHNLGFNTNEPLPSVQFLENKAHRIVLSILTSLWWSEETALITFKGKEATLLAEYYAVIFQANNLISRIISFHLMVIRILQNSSYYSKLQRITFWSLDNSTFIFKTNSSKYRLENIFPSREKMYATIPYGYLL